MNKALNMHIQNISFTIHLQLQQKIVYIFNVTCILINMLKDFLEY